MAHYATVQVDVYLGDIESDDLIEELKDRGYDVSKNGVVGDWDVPDNELHEIVQMHRTGNPQWEARQLNTCTSEQVRLHEQT